MMPTWKVLIVLVLSVLFLALGGAAVVVPMGMEGDQRWQWLGTLLPAALVTGGLLVWFLARASRNMD